MSVCLTIDRFLQLVIYDIVNFQGCFVVSRSVLQFELFSGLSSREKNLEKKLEFLSFIKRKEIEAKAKLMRKRKCLRERKEMGSRYYLKKPQFIHGWKPFHF